MDFFVNFPFLEHFLIMFLKHENLLRNRPYCLYFSYNSSIVDNIGVIDIYGKRYIDFDDDMFTMINKGIDVTPDVGLEPTTTRLKVWRSTILS